MNDDRNIPREVKEKIDIVEVIDRYVKLKKAGKNYSGLCPFHNEKTPSFIVSPDIQRYKCFGCGKSGDVITFIQEIETLDFPEALKKLAKEAGVQYAFSKTNSEFNKLEEINDEAAKFFQNELSKNQSAQDYLKKRGFTQATIKEFRIGYSAGYDSLRKYLIQKKYPKDIMKKSGLFSEKNGYLKDRFIKRIMFPIWSPYGKIVGFSGRNLPGDDFGPKYLNTPETKIFKKRSSLFGLYQAKSHIRKENLTVMTEGQIDVISAYSIGIKNIVAPLGTSLTNEQLQALKKYSEKILYIFDDDLAGQQALERAFILGSDENMLMYAANPSPFQDLDEMVQNDKSKAKALVKPKIDAYTFLLVRKLKGFDMQKLDSVKEIRSYHEKLTENVSDQDILKYYNQKYKKLTGKDPSRKTVSVKHSDASIRADKQATKADDTLSQEEYFISLTVKSDQIGKLQHVESKYFISPEIRQIIDIAKNEGCVSVECILNSVDIPRETADKLERSVFLQDKMPNAEDPVHTLNEIYLNIQIHYWKRVLEKYRNQLAIFEEQEDNDSARELSEKSMKITSKIRELNEKLSKL